MKLHNTEICPVPSTTIVIYRTKSRLTGIISHVHLPAFAWEINWGKSAKTVNHIYDYQKAKRLPEIFKTPLFSPAEQRKRNAM